MSLSNSSFIQTTSKKIIVGIYHAKKSMLVPAILTNQPPLNKNGGFLVCPILIAKEGRSLLFIAFGFEVKSDYINVYSESAISNCFNYGLTKKVWFYEVLVSVLNNQ